MTLSNMTLQKLIVSYLRILATQFQNNRPCKRLIQLKIGNARIRKINEQKN